jgi:flavin-dependent dehydrogenase
MGSIRGDSMEQGTDVLVIGGGPAGLAAAIAAVKKGFKVTVADGAKPPIDKVCGEGLMPNTLAAVRELGVEISPRDGQVFGGIRFLDGTTTAEASFPGLKGIGVRRTVLHEKMVERAKDYGVNLRWNTPVSGLSEEGAVVGGTVLKAKWIIGADGIRSRVRRWQGLGLNLLQKVRFAQRQRYRVKPWTDFVEIHWGRTMQAYVTPLGKDETCVALISRDSRMRLKDGLREFPKLAGRLAHAELSGAERGAVTAMCRLDRVFQGNVALLGDASGSVDAITGEGLGLSFRQAVALADALEKGELENYQRAHRRLARQPYRMALLLLLLERYPTMRGRVLRTLAKDPEVFARLLAVHTGEISPKNLAMSGLSLGWQFLVA